MGGKISYTMHFNIPVLIFPRIDGNLLVIISKKNIHKLIVCIPSIFSF